LYKAYKILVREAEGERPLRRHSFTWEDNIKMYLKERGLEGVGWVDLAQNMGRCRVLVTSAMKFPVSKIVRNFLTI
jgi:hypothetical protein